MDWSRLAITVSGTIDKMHLVAHIGTKIMPSWLVVAIVEAEILVPCNLIAFKTANVRRGLCSI